MLNVAVLGFSLSCSKKNQYLAIEAGKKIAELRFGIITGNTMGTTEYVFKGAKLANGHTYSIIEQQIIQEKNNYPERKNCDILHIVKNTEQKHKLLSSLCIGALVIGGGEGTLKAIQQFINQKKPVIAIRGSEGITHSELPLLFPNNQVTMCNDVQTATSKYIKFWKTI